MVICMLTDLRFGFKIGLGIGLEIGTENGVGIWKVNKNRMKFRRLSIKPWINILGLYRKFLNIRLGFTLLQNEYFKTFKEMLFFKRIMSLESILKYVCENNML